MRIGKLYKTLCFLIVLVSLTSAVSAAPQICMVSGKITNWKLEPIDGAKIIFEATENKGFAVSTYSDGNGNYSSNQMPSSGSAGTSYWITIMKDGYKPYRGKASYCSNEITRNFKLEPNLFPIGGKITDKNSEPIIGAQISFEQDGGNFGIQSATSNENGSYSAGIPNRLTTYWVTVRKEGYKIYRSRFSSSDYENVVNVVLKPEEQ